MAPIKITHYTSPLNIEIKTIDSRAKNPTVAIIIVVSNIN